MSKQIAFLLTGLSLAVSSVGCCCLGGYGRSNQCGCPTGTPGNTYYPPQTTMTQTFDGSQAAYSSGLTQTAYSSGPMQTAVINNGAIAGPPIMASPGGYTTTVMVPANSLPTY